MRGTHTFVRAEAPVVRRLLAWVGLGLGLAGCGGVEPVAISTPLNDATVYAGLVLNHHVATISTAVPYDTVQLAATPLDLTGAPITGLPAPVYFTTDTTSLSVTADGLVRAKKIGTNFKVIASLSVAGNLRHDDTITIDVTSLAPPPRLAQLVLTTTGSSPSALDSAVLGMAPNFTFSDVIAATIRAAILELPRWYSPPAVPFNYDVVMVRVPVLGRTSPTGFLCSDPACAPVTRISGLDSTGSAMPAVRVEARALDPSVATATISGGSQIGGRFVPRPVKPGQARFEVRTTAYGITMADTVTWKLTPPPYTMIHLAPKLDGTLAFLPNEVTIRTYGAVTWWNWSRDTAAIVFDDPTNVAMPSADICQLFITNSAFYANTPHCGSGNIAMPVPDTSLTLLYQTARYGQIRQFPVAGTYRFHDAITGATGEIVVRDN